MKSLIAWFFALGATCLAGQASAQTIHYLAVLKETELWPKVLGELTQEFAKTHPGVSWEYEYVPQENVAQRVQLLAGSDSLPTLFNAPSPAALADMYAHGQALNIAATFKDLGIYDQLNPLAVKIMQGLEDAGPDVLYDVPLELNIEGFWYNKKIFKDHGIEVPKTWTEMTAAAKKLKDSGVQPFAASGQQGWPIGRLVQGYALRKLGYDAMTRVKNGKLKLTDPAFIEAAQVIQDYGKTGYFGKDPNGLDYGAAEDLFLQGKAAIFYMGSWAVRDFYNPEADKIGADNIGFFNVPAVEGGVGTIDDWSMNCGLTSVISKQAYDADPKRIGEWIKFVFSRYGDRAITEFSSIVGFKQTPPASLPPLTKFTLDTLGSVKHNYLYFEAYFTPKAKAMAEANVQQLITGDISAKQYMSDLEVANSK